MMGEETKMVLVTVGMMVVLFLLAAHLLKQKHEKAELAEWIEAIEVLKMEFGTKLIPAIEAMSKAMQSFIDECNKFVMNSEALEVQDDADQD